MSVYTSTCPFFQMTHKPLPKHCNGCSQLFSHHIEEPFVYWAFQGAEWLDPQVNPLTNNKEIVCEDGPHIALCWQCALKIGRDLIEDGAFLRAVNGDYPDKRKATL